MTELTSLSVATFFLMFTQLHPLSVPASSLQPSKCNFSEDDCLNAKPVDQTGSSLEGEFFTSSATLEAQKRAKTCISIFHLVQQTTDLRLTES